VTRFAVDGIDCAGKSTLADALGSLLHGQRLSIDDFLRPAGERYRRGDLSPEGYYRDSHDLEGFRAAVEAADTPLVADGVFLQRPELDDLWDVRIWLEISFERALERALVRDAERVPDLRRSYEERYFPGQRLYLDEVDPRSRAEIVVTAPA
jgi:uridine kinase